MNGLNNQQVTLLAILVAFVTSIATGIVTASLLDQTTESVPQTIYKVVERTIQEVAPESTVAKKIEEKDSPKQPVEKPLVLSDVAETAGKSLVKIYFKASKSSPEILVSSGAIFGKQDTFLGITPIEYPLKTKFSIELPDKSRVEATLLKKGSFGFSVFTIDPNAKPNISSLKLAGLGESRIGSSVVAFGAKQESNVVSTGIVTEIESLSQATASTTPKGIAITDIRLSSPTSGWLLLSTKGEVLGFIIAPKEGDRGARYVDAMLLKAAFPEIF